MIKHIKQVYPNFTNERGYSFNFTYDDFKKEFIGSIMNDEYGRGKEYLYYYNGGYDVNGEHLGDNKSYNLPKKVTLEWLHNKINNDKLYINFAKDFKKLINNNSILIYATSYGIGISSLYNNNFNNAKKEIFDKLDNLGIKFDVEYSDAMWIYRIKISKSKDNINIISNL